MFDIHCHIIFGVDDGSLSVKDSIKMILEADKIGVTTIIATPHFHKGIYNSDKVAEHYYNIKSRIENFGIDFFLGHEVFLCSALPDIITDKYKYTLNNSKYLLFELPFNILPIGLNRIILKLQSENIKPIIAHPERNRYFISNTKAFWDLVESGCLVQVDAASIIGVYGTKVKRFSRRLIELNLVDFIASDAHRPKDYSEWHIKAYYKVKNWVGKEYCDKLFSHNQKILLDTSATV